MVHWKFSLAIILLCITVFIPLSFSLVLTYRRSANGTKSSATRRLVLTSDGISRYSTPAEVVCGQVSFDGTAGLTLPSHPLLCAIALLHIRNVGSFRHSFTPHCNRNGHSWSPFWVWFHQQRVGLPTYPIQRPKVLWQCSPRRHVCAHYGLEYLQTPMFRPLNRLWLECDKIWLADGQIYLGGNLLRIRLKEDGFLKLL